MLTTWRVIVSTDKLPNLIDFQDNNKYDFSQISRIVEALEFLNKEAKKSNNRDIELIISSAFNLCFCAYYLAMRYKIELDGQSN